MKEKISKYFKGDLAIWIIVLLLTIASMLTVYSATGTLAYKKMGGNTFYYLFKHLAFLLLGIGIMYIVHNIPYIIYFNLSRVLVIAAIPLLLFTMFKGISLNQASRWITLPGTGLSFQTSDLAKMALIMYMARVLSIKKDTKEKEKSAFMNILLVVGGICFLIMPSNLSTALMMFFISLVMMFVGRMKFKYILSLLGLGLIAGILFIFIIQHLPQSRAKTWSARIENFINGEEGNNFQVDNSKIAIVNGGFMGKGPGNSIQRNVLPHPYSDFIYAIIIEEYGLAGGFIVLCLYLSLLFRVGIIVRRSSRTFPALLAAGFALMIVIQALINMAVAVNLVPVTGQTLPFISMGGTSIIITSVIIGIILSVSRWVNEETLKQKLATADVENKDTKYEQLEKMQEDLDSDELF